MAMEHLKSLLKSQNVSQTQLAMVLGRDKSAVTNLLQGKRQLKAEEVIKISRYLNVPEATVLGIEPVSLASSAPAPSVTPLGFSEPEAIPFMAAPTARLQSAQAIQKKGETFYLSGLGSVRPSMYALEVKDESLNLSGFMVGDIVISDMERPAKPGDVVVVQHYVNDAAVTVLRRYDPPYLLPHSTTPDMERLHESRGSVRVVSPVIRLIRLLD